MNRAKFLKITLPLVVILAVVTPFLSGDILETYISVMEPLALIIGSLLALRISFVYRKQLKATFAYFSAYLFILASFLILFPRLRTVISGDYYVPSILVVQVIDYVMLALFCMNLLRAVRLSGLNKNAWITFSITAAICLFLALYPPAVDGILEFSLYIIIYMAMRLLDAALVIALVPIIWLYVKYLKSQQRQSLTFTVIIFGIICSTVFDYLFATIVRIFSLAMIEDSFFYAVIPHTLFILGYFVIVVGLYAHLKDEQWGFAAVDIAMSGGLELAKDK